MARTDRARTVRQKDDFRQGRRDVVLQESRRFFSARGGEGAVRSARALTNALGVGLEAFTGKLGRDNTRGTARAAKEAASGGDRDETDTNKGYNEAFDQVEAANDLAIFANELPELLTNEAWADMSEADAQTRIDAYYSSQLAGINPDSVYGKIVADGILKQNSNLLQVHRGYKAEQAQQERRIMVDNELRADYKLNKGKIDFLKLAKRIKDLVPGPGGRRMFLESIFDLAEDEGDVALIDGIPEFFPGGDPTGITDQNMEKLFDDARANAKSVFDERKKAADDAFMLENQTTLAKLHFRDWDMAKAGDERVLQNIANGGELGPNDTPRRYTRAQQLELYKTLANAHETGEDTRLLLRDWVNSNGIGYSQNETDAAHVAYVGWLKDNIPKELAGDAEAIDDYIQQTSLALGVQNGQLPSVYRDQMGVNLSNPEKFKDAAGMYSQVEALRPGFAETQIGNPQSMKLYAYNRMLSETKGDEDKAIELMGAYEQGRSQTKPIQPLIAKVNKKAVEVIVENGWSRDFATTSRLQSLVDEEVRFYVDAGNEPEVAGKYAVEHIQRRYIRVGDHVYPPDAGWGTNPQSVYDFQIAEMAKQRNVDPDTLSIIPTGDPLIVRIESTESTLPSTELHNISDLTLGYNAFNSVDEQARKEAHRTAGPEALGIAEKRAFDKRYTVRSFGEPGMVGIMHALNLESWKEMDPDKKQRLINDELINSQ